MEMSEMSKTVFKMSDRKKKEYILVSYPAVFTVILPIRENLVYQTAILEDITYK